MSGKPNDTATIWYQPPRSRYAKVPDSSIDPWGIDTEALTTGKMFMLCTSEGDVFHASDYPDCLFSRKLRDRAYVAYNLKYDAGAFVQHLPVRALSRLRSTGRCEHDGYRYHVISNKLFTIAKGKHYVTIYDIMQYYGGSLDYNAERYLGDKKKEVGTKKFTTDYVYRNWDKIAEYCIHDAKLTRDLARRLVGQLNSWGMHVTKLYSTAWVSYSWFASKCGHPEVGHIWRYDRRILDMAMRSYTGGKFEVTTKGPSMLYEYDIVSAYPSSIANLVSLRNIVIVWTNRYRDDAVYGFLEVDAKIPIELPSPVAVKIKYRNVYPSGIVHRVITKQEYDYLVAHGADVTIRNAVWIMTRKLEYPYRDEINRLVALKQEYKGGDKLAYHTIKIILNSLYGKFVQLVQMQNGRWRAGSSWNPIYGSVITAETRVRITDLQRQYPSIWAVHTDSVISDAPLPYPESHDLGALSYETEGRGIILACGIYQIGDKCAIRGVPSKVRLDEIAQRGGATVDVSSMQPLSWRQTLQRNYSTDEINRWQKQLKRLRCAMDGKRVWIEDWTDWREVLEREVYSVPHVLV